MAGLSWTKSRKYRPCWTKCIASWSPAAGVSLCAGPRRGSCGAALETLIYHELRIYNEISRKQRRLSYYRTPAGVEVDFIVETAGRRPGRRPRVVAIEVKRAERWDRSWEKPLRSLSESSGVKVERSEETRLNSSHTR